jgi:hypothetical protein
MVDFKSMKERQSATVETPASAGDQHWQDRCRLQELLQKQERQ